MSSLLGNVIIMDKLANAVALQKKYRYAYKVVTLEGELLSPGGAITGGSRQQQNAGLLGRGRQISELAEQMSALRRETDALDVRLRGEKSKLSATEEALQRARDAYQETLLEQNNLRNQAAQSEEKLKNLRSSAEACDRENESLMARLVETNKAIREIKKEATEQEAAVELARKQMADYQQEITDERLKQNEQTQALMDLRVEIGRKTEAFNQISQNIYRFGKEHAALLAEKELLEKERAKAEAALEAKLREAETARALRSEWKERLNAEQNELENAEKERAGQELEIERNSRDERDRQDETARLEKEIARLETRREQFN